MTMTIKKASRTGVKPLIGFYSESGCGKTMSGLLLARGLVGPSGKIVMIDTESGRGSLYADVIEGGYDVLEFASRLAQNDTLKQSRPSKTLGRKLECLIQDLTSGKDLGGSSTWLHSARPRAVSPDCTTGASRRLNTRSSCLSFCNRRCRGSFAFGPSSRRAKARMPKAERRLLKTSILPQFRRKISSLR